MLFKNKVFKVAAAVVLMFGLSTSVSSAGHFRDKHAHSKGHAVARSVPEVAKRAEDSPQSESIISPYTWYVDLKLSWGGLGRVTYNLQNPPGLQSIPPMVDYADRNMFVLQLDGYPIPAQLLKGVSVGINFSRTQTSITTTYNYLLTLGFHYRFTPIFISQSPHYVQEGDTIIKKTYFMRWYGEVYAYIGAGMAKHVIKDGIPDYQISSNRMSYFKLGPSSSISSAVGFGVGVSFLWYNHYLTYIEYFANMSHPEINYFYEYWHRSPAHFRSDKFLFGIGVRV